MTRLAEILTAMSTAPTEEVAFNAWLELADAVCFLEENARHSEFVAYLSMPFGFINTVSAPVASLSPPDVDDLMAWNFNPRGSWGIEYCSSEPSSVRISQPLECTGTKTLESGEQLVFARHFDGRLGSKAYCEILQKFTHIFGIHFVAERNAYCRIDKHGDIEEAVKIVEVSGKGEGFVGRAVIFQTELLQEYITLTDSALVRTFDFTRFRSGSFSGWNGHHSSELSSRGELFYRSHIEPGNGSYIRGFQIVRSYISKNLLVNRLDPISRAKQEYASFVAFDWKNGVAKEISCAPGCTANYFTKSDLPFELSPAFFRPEVLTKYKADSEKYRLGDRSISCRETWHLETYDINDAGQVHTYLVYLRDLPFEEQLHWKAYNEYPKAPISRRAFKTDFEGSWDIEYDPLSSLKDAARQLYVQQVPWWTLRSERLLDQVQYPVTASPDEWSNEILQLDQVVVEGFETKWLKKHASSRGRTLDPKAGSLQLVQEGLIALGYEAVEARRIVSPLRTAHDLRSKLKGHASGKAATEIKRQVVADHQTYRQHFPVLCQQCDESLRELMEAFKNIE